MSQPVSHLLVVHTITRISAVPTTSVVRRSIAIGLVAATLLTACGSDTGDPASADPTSSDPSGPPSLELVDLDELDLDALSAEEADVEVRTDTLPVEPANVDDVTGRSVTLIDRFGSDGAFDALLLALARGYSAEAIATAITADTLDALGFIDGVDPTLAASTLLELPSPVQGLRAATTTTTEPQRLTVERLRQVAENFDQVSQRALEPWQSPEIATGEGVAMLWLVQELADVGLSGDQIINAIVLGYGGIKRRYLQIGMGGTIAVCRFVEIGGKPEPIGDDRCERYAQNDLKMREAYLAHGVNYPPCEGRSVEGIYDACAAEQVGSGSDEGEETTDDGRATSGVWSGEGTTTGSTGVTEWWGRATIVLADGVYTLTYEITQETNSDCNTFSELESEASATPDEHGNLLFTSMTERFIVSDCPFYEPKGGEDVEVAERFVSANLLDDDQIRLDLLPGSHFLMEHTPG